MEQHPVPRNISSFEFHLIGDMTLRQFGYLAGGAFIAYVTFRLSPLPQIINIPLAALFGFCGVAFAFLPIQERPLDKWLLAFIRSIFSPTQYLWHKESIIADMFSQPSVVRIQVTNTTHLIQHNEAKSKLAAYLATVPSKPHENLNLAEKKYLENTLSLFGPQPHTNTSSTHTVIASRPHTVPHQIHAVPKTILSAPSQKLQSNVPIGPSPQKSTIAPSPNTTPQKPSQEPPVPASAGTTPIAQTHPVSPPLTNTAPMVGKENYQKKWDQIAKEKEALENELKRLHEELAKLKQPEVVTPTALKEVKPPTIQTIAQTSTAKEIGATFPQYPNMIVGIIQDPQKKFLPNIIVTIKDKNGTPLRALKTNKLGQFSTATPLSNGVYHLEMEDPLKRYFFDIAEITLSGNIFPPIEILAKGERELMREKLTKELFGSVNS
ncbi:PrgI family protein [Candidatus Gottesmanbacteria bacterium]|nr:PrgI family protein [Candidatus Gottesmanbacteria bacterium]